MTTIAPVFPDGIDEFYDAATLSLHRDDGGLAVGAPVDTPQLPENRAEYDARVGEVLQQIEIRVGYTGDSNVLSHETRLFNLEAIGPGGSGMSPTLLNAQTVLTAVADNTPVALAIPEQTVLGRITGGDVAALSVGTLKTMLGYVIGDFDTSLLVAGINSKTAKSANLSDLASRDTAVTTLLGSPIDITALPSGWSQGSLDTLVAIQDSMPVSITSQQLFNGGIDSGSTVNGGRYTINDTGAGVSAAFFDVAANQPELIVGTFFAGAFIGFGPGGSTFPDANMTYSEAGTIGLSYALRVTNVLGNANRGARWVGGSGGGVPGGIVGQVGDFLFDRAAGTVLVCTSAGSPGTWATSLTTTSPTFLNSWSVWDGTAAHGAVGAGQSTFSPGVGWSTLGVFNVSTDPLPSAGAQQIGGSPSLGMGPGSSGFDIVFTRVNSTNFTVTGAPTFLNNVNLGTGSLAVNVAIASLGSKIGTSTSQLIGFWNATPSAQISGSTDLLAGLVTIGLRGTSSNPPLDLGSGAFSGGTLELRATDQTFTSQPNWVLWNNTYTVDFASASIGQFLNMVPTVLLNQAGNSFGNMNAINISPVVKNVSSVAGANFGLVNGITTGITLTADTQTGLTGSIIDWNSGPVTSVVSGGTMTLSAITNVQLGATLGAGSTTTAFTNLKISEYTGSGTATTHIAIDIASLTKGGTNIGLRNKSLTQLGSSAQCSIDMSGNLATSGSILSSGTGGIGYATGAGGTVAQTGSRTTAVTLNKLCGTITLLTATLAADTDVTFTLTNSTIAAGDLISFNIIAGAAVKGGYSVNAICAAGSAQITVRNHTPTITASEAPQIAFWVHKGVNA